MLLSHILLFNIRNYFALKGWTILLCYQTNKLKKYLTFPLNLKRPLLCLTKSSNQEHLPCLVFKHGRMILPQVSCPVKITLYILNMISVIWYPIILQMSFIVNTSFINFHPICSIYVPHHPLSDSSQIPIQLCQCFHLMNCWQCPSFISDGNKVLQNTVPLHLAHQAEDTLLNSVNHWALELPIIYVRLDQSKFLELTKIIDIKNFYGIGTTLGPYSSSTGCAWCSPVDFFLTVVSNFLSL